MSAKKRPNPQRHPRAASFKRIAKGYRADARSLKAAGDKDGAKYFSLLATRLQAEATLLRSMP